MKKFLLYMCMIIFCVSTACNSIIHDFVTTENRRLTPENMIFVKGGCFQMGDEFGNGDPNEVPVHEACVDDFYISKYEVTVGEFKTFVKEIGYMTDAEKGGGCYRWFGKDWAIDKENSWHNTGFSQTEKDPAMCVSWNDAQEYIKWISNKSGRIYRLPTEAEWEYACRSGGKNEKFAGFSSDNDIYKYANFCDINCALEWKIKEQDDKYPHTSPVGSYKPNRIGLYDMSGNAWEWVEDWYDKDYYKTSSKNNPEGPANGDKRVIRGGRWDSEPKCLRCANRYYLPPDHRTFNIGFRLSSKNL